MVTVHKPFGLHAFLFRKNIERNGKKYAEYAEYVLEYVLKVINSLSA